MTSSPDRDIPLVLAAGTLGTFDLVERIDAASAAGFVGLGLRAADVERTLSRGVSIHELRQRLDDAGLRVVEVQYVADWAAEGAAAAESRRMEEGCFRVVDAFGADYVIVGSSEQPHGWDAAVERFAELCDRATTHGVALSVEFLPWGTVPDAGAAWRLVAESGRPHAGVLLDSWHHFRGAHDEDLLRAVPPGGYNGVQINDARTEIRGSLVDDTRDERLFPGDGDLDMAAFVRLVDELAPGLPWSVEVLSTRVRAMSPAEAARKAADSTRRAVLAARAAAS